MNECYVIYAAHKDIDTNECVGVTIIRCVKTLADVMKYLDDKQREYGNNGKWIDNDAVLLIDDELGKKFYLSYDNAVMDFEGV